MPYYTVTDPFGARTTVLAAGVDSAKVLACHELGLHPQWPMTVLRRPDPPAIRTRTRLWVRSTSIVPQRIVEVA